MLIPIDTNPALAGGQDKLSDPMDVELLLQVLPHEFVWQWHDEPDYEHLDFIWGINAKYLLYQKVLNNLQKGRDVGRRQQEVVL
jgi:hypothetical protein